MRKNLHSFNAKRVQKTLFTIENGIGLVTDFVISGVIGSQTGRKSFTIAGRAIERANHLESMTRESENKILVCSKTAGQVKNHLQLKEFQPDTFAVKEDQET
jgi:class 3 adenylate cyclase